MFFSSVILLQLGGFDNNLYEQNIYIYKKMQHAWLISAD